MVGCPPGAVVEALTRGRTAGGLRRIRPRISLPGGSAPRVGGDPAAGVAPSRGARRLGGGGRRVRRRSTHGPRRVGGCCSDGPRRRSSIPTALPMHGLSPGDTVRFTAAPVRDSRSPTPSAPARAALAAGGDRFVEVLDPGLLSLVEDGGRSATAGIGVPPAGPADAESMRLANRLVGNPDRTATIEVTAVGPRLRFTGDAHVGVVASTADGVEVRIDDHPVAAGAVSPVFDGQVIDHRDGSSPGSVPTWRWPAVSRPLWWWGPGRPTCSPAWAGSAGRPATDWPSGPPSDPMGRCCTRSAPPMAGQPAELRVLAGPHRHPAGDATGWVARLDGGRPLQPDRRPSHPVPAASFARRRRHPVGRDGHRGGAAPSRRKSDHPRARPRHGGRISGHRLCDHRRPARAWASCGLETPCASPSSIG